MAQRFGGKYSPDANRTAEGPQTDHSLTVTATAKTQGWGRADLLFLPPFLFAFRAFRSDPQGLVLGLVACAVLLLAAWLTREGVKAQAAYDERKIARRPALPRKLLGAALTGIGLVIGGMGLSASIITLAMIGIAGLVLHFGAFGPDPLADKGMEGVDSFQVDRVARAVGEAEKTLAGMKDAILRAKDRTLELRVDKFAETARSLFRSVESDPGDLTAARKYLSVYLMGARDATVKFADAYAQSRDPAIRADYESLLTDLETNFAQRTKDMLSGSHNDLDIEIAVLRDRLKLEG
jgi:hypothetical protein